LDLLARMALKVLGEHLEPVACLVPRVLMAHQDHQANKVVMVLQARQERMDRMVKKASQGQMVIQD